MSEMSDTVKVSERMRAMVEDALDASHVHEMLVIENAPKYKIEDSRQKARAERDALLLEIAALETESALVVSLREADNGCDKKDVNGKAICTRLSPCRPCARNFGRFLDRLLDRPDLAEKSNDR